MSRRYREHSYYESNARERLFGILDEGSFREFVGPRARATSPHLAQLDVPGAFDDGVIVGEGTLDGRRVLAAAPDRSAKSMAPRSSASWSARLPGDRTAYCCCSTPAACACMKPTPD